MKKKAFAILTLCISLFAAVALVGCGGSGGATGSGGGGGYAVLTGAGLGNEAGLAHPFCQKGLADAVVDLMGAGMVQILSL